MPPTEGFKPQLACQRFFVIWVHITTPDRALIEWCTVLVHVRPWGQARAQGASAFTIQVCLEVCMVANPYLADPAEYVRRIS